MADEAMIGAGTDLSVGDYPTAGILPVDKTGIANLVEVTQVIDLTPEGDEFGTVDVSHLKSADAFRDKIPGWGNARTVTGQQNYTEARRAQLEALKPNPLDPTAARGRKTWVRTFPDGSYVMFKGFLKSVGENIPGDDNRIVTPFTIEVSGKPRFVLVA